MGMNPKFEAQLEKFREKMEGNIFGGLLIFIPDANHFVRLSYGAGDNLLHEDKAEGYDDYIYITIDEFDDGWEEDVDGGQMMLKMQEEWKGHYNICQHAVDALDFMGYLCEKAIILQSFTH